MISTLRQLLLRLRMSLLYVIQWFILITWSLDPLSPYVHMVWRFLKGKGIRCTVDDFVLVSHMLGCFQRKAAGLVSFKRNPVACTKSVVKAENVLCGDIQGTFISYVLETFKTTVLLQLPEIGTNCIFILHMMLCC